MLYYFIIFTAIGLVLGFALKDKQETAMTIIIGISVVWGLTNAIVWGFATFGELILGYVVAQALTKKSDQV